MGVGAVDSKVDSAAPHAIVAVVDVEAFLAFVDDLRVRTACPVEKDINERLSATMLILDFLFLVLEYFPEFLVLNPLDLKNLGTWLGCLESCLEVLPLKSCFVNILNQDLILPEEQIIDVLPLLGKRCLRHFI